MKKLLYFFLREIRVKASTAIMTSKKKIFTLTPSRMLSLNKETR